MAANKKTTKNKSREEQPQPMANGTPARRGTAADKSAAPAKGKRGKKQPDAKRISALDAAAKVLGEQGKPMNCQEMIDAMAAKGYWTSPGGKTPSATLYTAVTMLPKWAPSGGL